MEKEVVEKYVKAGEILKKMKDLAKKDIKVGKNLLDIADKIENEIVAQGGKPAFPVNLSWNNTAAHYTPSIEDATVVGEDFVLKVDIGVHIDGYIADGALTLDFSGEYSKLLEASEQALENAVSMVKVGVLLEDIGKEIEKTIQGYGFEPVNNLSGHGLMQWLAHTEPSIPNNSIRDDRELDEDMVFAIEPFATNDLDNPFVREGSNAEIFQIDEPKNVRNMHARKIMQKVLEEHKTLPFAERWVGKDMSEFARKTALRELVRNKCIRSYAPLSVTPGKMVSQFEKTIVLDGSKVIVLG